MENASIASLVKPKRDAQLLISLSLTAPAFWAFSRNPTALSLLEIVLLDWILFSLVYGFNRLTEAGIARVPGSHKFFLGGLLVAFFPCLLCLPNGVGRVAATVFLANGFLYSVRFRRAGRAPFQVKSLYLVKPLMVAGGHCLQWIIFTGRLDVIVLLITAWHFFDLFVMTSLLDIPDRVEDMAAGVKTFAVVHGIRRTFEIAIGANILCMAAGIAVVVWSGSWPLALFLFPRALSTQRRLMRLRARKVATSVDPTWLRGVGLVGIGLYLLDVLSA